MVICFLIQLVTEEAQIGSDGLSVSIIYVTVVQICQMMPSKQMSRGYIHKKKVQSDPIVTQSMP